MPDPDDERLGQILRALRRRTGLTQAQLCELTGVPVEDISSIERGRAADVRVGRIRAALETVDARLYLNPWWHGAKADRLLDQHHAALVERVTDVLRRRGWTTIPELTFAEFGERGAIDLFASHERSAAVAIAEIKTAFGSLEETNRRLDVKVRLAPQIARRVLGWTPKHVARLLVVPDEPIARRIVRTHAATMDAIYPERSRAIRTWLRRPTRSLAGIWFLSIPAHSGVESANRP